MCNLRNPIYCAIPPYMLEKVVENGTTTQMRAAALKQIKQANHFRTQRVTTQERPKFVNEIMSVGIDSHSFQRIRRVYDAKQQEELPGTLVRGENDPPTGDKAVDEAFDGAGATWDFFMEEYQRNSIDDEGMILDQTVHYGEDFNNAFWNSKQMVYGDGDGELFNRFTIDIDIIAHELSHGVTEHEAGLVYFYQSGALNESFSDVFGSLVKQYKLGQEAREADWLIGANVLVGDYALRSMKAPGTAYQNHPIIGSDPQPATMDDYQTLAPWEDNGGVHINSGIPNYAFYNTAMELGGKAWEKAGHIWYLALRDKLRKYDSFVRAARATVRVAREEYGRGSLEEKAVIKGWKATKLI